MLNNLDNNIGKKKQELLEYYRSRALELIGEVKQTYGETDYKLRASAVNSGLIDRKSVV